VAKRFVSQEIKQADVTRRVENNLEKNHLLKYIEKTDAKNRHF